MVTTHDPAPKPTRTQRALRHVNERTVLYALLIGEAGIAAAVPFPLDSVGAALWCAVTILVARKR